MTAPLTAPLPPAAAVPPKVPAPDAHGGHHEEAQPLGGKILTPTFLLIFALGAVGAALIVYRFAFGLSTITNLTDTWPWGIWKPMNVVAITGVGAGGYGLALIVYLLNKGQYHPFVRPALLTSALAYTVAGSSVLVDLSRWWSILKVPAYVWLWNGNSVLLEVAICVLTYLMVLWAEVSPAMVEGAQKASRWPKVAAWAKRFSPKLSKAMPFIIAFGVVLPSLHQSSLGGMYMVSTYLHPLWHTAFLPLLFLLSCLVMGYAGVVAQDTLTRVVLKRRQEYELLPRLSVVAIALVAAWWGVRLLDLALKGRLGLVFTSGANSAYFLAEFGLAFFGAAVLAVRRWRWNPGMRFGAAVLLLASGGLYRFSTYLLAIEPRQPGSYFPSVGELVVSGGLIALALCVFIFVAKKFPIIVGPASAEPRAREV